MSAAYRFDMHVADVICVTRGAGLRSALTGTIRNALDNGVETFAPHRSDP